MRSLVAVLIFAASLVIACADSKPAVDQVTGVVVEIESEGLEDVRSFTLRSEGETYEIFIDPNVDYGFALSHLNAHRASAAPVTVDLGERDGRLYALSIVDV